MQIQDLDLAVELHSIKKGLWARPFANSQAINPPRSLAKFRERAMGYINIEDVQKTQKTEARTENGRADDSK